MDYQELNMLYQHKKLGSEGPIEYHFQTYSGSKVKQSNSSYLILPIQTQEDNLHSADEDSKSKYYIGGLVYCNWKGLADKVMKEFLYNFKETIYYKIGNYEQAFQNALNFLKEYVYSLELVSDTCQQVWQGYDAFDKTLISANFFFKMDDKLFLSNSIYPKEQIQNTWYIKEKGQEIYRKLDQNKDGQSISAEYFEIKSELNNNLSDLILSDSTNYFDGTMSVIQKDEQLIFYDFYYFYNIHFLKLSFSSSAPLQDKVPNDIQALHG